MEEKSYEIGGKTYIQRALVLGQIKQLKGVLAGVEISEDFTVQEIIETLEDRLYQALAIVLTEAGTALKGKDLPTLAEELEWSIPPETAFEVIEDFFICNPTASLLNKLAGVIGKIRGLMGKGTGSTNSASSSAEETLSNETTSSGDTLSESVSPTGSTGNASCCSARQC